MGAEAIDTHETATMGKAHGRGRRLMVAPPAAAHFFVRHLSAFLGLSVLFGVVSALAGY